MTQVVIFAPAPLLTVTVEDHPDGPDVHIHAGGQGVWQARMIRGLGVEATLCSAFTGETGRVLRRLLADEEIPVFGVDRDGLGGVYIHDRRGGERRSVVETGGDPLARHELDELYGITLREGLDADLVILSGPSGEDAVPHDIYRRLAADLSNAGRQVVVDLAGERLTKALAGGVAVAKVSDEELLADARVDATTTDQVIAAMHAMQEEGARAVIVTRAEKPLLVLANDVVAEVTPPTIEVADSRGAGDSLTAGVAASLARGEPIEHAITLGAAAGALNVTRHGLGTGDPEAVAKLRELVTVRHVNADAEASENLSPDQLAMRAEEK